ncbi:MAG: SLBB domain-containing protein [Candidatus Aminicenantes bacterium]|nr:SLBB domain-containing protein [Candidatus Aminicenantes bacterium]
MQEDIINAVYRAGVVGAGGGGFPTHIKLQARVDTVIANGSECEPLLYSDKTLLKNRAYAVVEGMKHVFAATGAQVGYIAVKEDYKEVAAAVEAELPRDGSIKLHLLENYYPAGDEFLTVYDVTGRIIPEGGLPLHVGVLVSNVLSLAQIADALNGKPVTERPVTIAGSVKQPQVVTVPIGASYRDLVEIAGGTLEPTDVLIDGGPMMGVLVEDARQGIAKTTGAVIVLPEDHFIVKMRNITISQMVKKSKAACCQCIRCSDLCPRNLLGHALFPHMTMRTIDYDMAEPTDHITSAFLCSQCGMCELVACDVMQLSPKKVYAEYKKQLMLRGIKNPHKEVPAAVLPEIEYRKVPISAMLKKLALGEYAVNIPALGAGRVGQVRIALDRHTGVPAQPRVAPGEKVRMGDVIAASPAGETGTVYHASIAGQVTEVTDTIIEIKE